MPALALAPALLLAASLWDRGEPASVEAPPPLPPMEPASEDASPDPPPPLPPMEPAPAGETPESPPPLPPMEPMDGNDGEQSPPPLAPMDDGDGSAPPLDPVAGTSDVQAFAPTRERKRFVLGSARLVGAYLHYGEQPPPLPQDDDAILGSVFRLLSDHRFDNGFGFDVNLFMDLSRAPDLTGAGGTFVTAGGIESAYRSPYLLWSFWDNGSVSGQLGVDRFAVEFHKDRVSVSFGRFPVNYSVTNVFNPNDFYAPFAPTAINRIYKPGVDAVRVGVMLGTLSNLELVGALGYNDDGVPNWGRASTFARISAVGWGFEWSALGGKIAERWVAGASIQGDIDRFTLRSEAHVGFPDANGDGKLDPDRDVHVRLAAGPDVSFAWQNLVIGAEYAFFSDGGKDPDDYLNRAGRFFADDVPYLGRHYVGASMGMEIIPILRFSAITLVNAGDGSGLAGPFLMLNVADEADLLAGVFIPWGKGADLDPTSLNLDLGSEYGLASVSAYLETRVAF